MTDERLIQILTAAGAAGFIEVFELLDERAVLKMEVARLTAVKENLKLRNQILRVRTDLPIERTRLDTEVKTAFETYQSNAGMVDAIFQHCKVICWPAPIGIAYPLEHTRAANKDMRAAIEKELLQRINGVS